MSVCFDLLFVKLSIHFCLFLRVIHVFFLKSFVFLNISAILLELSLDLLSKLTSTSMAEKPMTKSGFVAFLAEKSNMSKKDVVTFWDLIVDTAYKQAKSAGEITLPGLGKLMKKARAARQGRNPATGATIQIPAKTVVKFRVAKAAKDSILGK